LHTCTSDRALFFEVDLLGGRKITRDLPENDNRFCGDLGLDAPVHPDRQHVVLQVDLALDATLDREILAAGQLAVDDDALPTARQLLVHGPLPSWWLIESQGRSLP